MEDSKDENRLSEADQARFQELTAKLNRHLQGKLTIQYMENHAEFHWETGPRLTPEEWDELASFSSFLNANGRRTGQ